MANNRTKLTDSRISRLAAAPKGKRYEVTDEEMPALVVRVTDKGTKSFLYKGKFPGRSTRTVAAKIDRRNPDNIVRRQIGIVGVMTVEQARTVAREWAELLRQGKDPAEEMQERKAALAVVRDAKFGSVLADWNKAHLSKLRRGREMKRALDFDCLPVWEHRPVANLTREDVLALIKRIAGRGAHYVAHNVARTLHSFFAWALNEGAYGLTHHPMEYPRKIEVAKTIGPRRARERELEDPEIRAYWLAAERLGYPYGAFFKVLLLTGLRRDEVARMKWPELDLEQGIFKLPASRFKSQREHVHPLGSAAVDILKILPRFKSHPKGYVFTTTYGAKAINSFGYMKSVALHERMLEVLRQDDPEAEIEQWGLHDTRRTMRTRLSMLGVSYEVAELCLGHKLRGLHSVYDRYSYIPERRRAFDLYGAHVLDIVKGRKVVPIREAAE